MQVFGFDLLPYPEHMDHLKVNGELPYPYGLMTSPNLIAAAASQRTQRMKLLIYGNLLPIHNPLRLAEELSMLDCLTNGRLISGFARGIPREYVAYGVDLAESRGLQGFRNTTLADLERSERLAWGSPEQVRDTLIELAESLGAGTLMLNFNQGAMPHDMFMRNLERFGTEVLPAVQAHKVTIVPIT